jgi:hypothetical protein
MSAGHPQAQFISTDTVHMKNESCPRMTLARDSTFGARSDSWEVLRVGLLDVERLLSVPGAPTCVPLLNCPLVSPPPAHPGGGLTLGGRERQTSHMSTLQFTTPSSGDNPLDLVEQLASQNEWPFDRPGDEEMHLSFPGQTEDHHLTFSWRSNVETLQLSVQLEVKVPRAKRSEIASLINIINEQLCLGHFEMWPDSGQVTYRHGLLLRNAMGTPEQCEGMIDAALEACERYHSTFQFVIWAGKSAAEAAASAVYQCQGNA